MAEKSSTIGEAAGSGAVSRGEVFHTHREAENGAFIGQVECGSARAAWAQMTPFLAESLPPSRERAILLWMAEGDTGTSSETLALASLGIARARGSWAPGDENDCGRCERLAARCPFVVEALPALLERDKRWGEWEARIRQAAEVGNASLR